MKLSSLLALLALAVVFSCAAFSQAAMPRMVSVDPLEGKAGDALTITGENLEKGNVAKLYLTDGKNDLEMQMLEQSATTIKAKVPAKCAAGRWALMILTSGKEPKLIEQPVKVTIE